MDENHKSQRKNWDFIIGIMLVLFGGLRLYNTTQHGFEWGYKPIFIIAFMLYGGYLIFRHFQNSSKK